MIALAARLSDNQTRHLWLFDSFQGLPPATEEDGGIVGAHVGTLVADPAKVKEVLDRVGTPYHRVHIVPGWFQETLRSAPIEKIALIHIDADWYESVKLCLEHFYEKVSPNGVIVLNDYGTWYGAKRAVDEFIVQRGLKMSLRWVDPGTRYFLNQATDDLKPSIRPDIELSETMCRWSLASGFRWINHEFTQEAFNRSVDANDPRSLISRVWSRRYEAFLS